ncbi:winged helix-turn-helix transcriptional regulator [Halovenus marina]|uniref:winged helix-turn-helix transcriptional regulator n=1 Tax=Halovenus marina TaxID=3396621 RepID=UPI003F56B91A
MADRPGPDPTVDPEEILRIIKLAYPPALGTADIADEIGISNQATARHLKRLQEDGHVDSRKVGQVRIWWITDEGERKIGSQSSDSQ